MKSNRMRNIHSYLTTKYGKEIVESYWRWEKYEYKMGDFQNHRQFSTAKEVSRILKPLVGRSPHHVMNNLEFLESIKGIQLQPEECMVSYDVEALLHQCQLKNPSPSLKSSWKKTKTYIKEQQCQ